MEIQSESESAEEENGEDFDEKWAYVVNLRNQFCKVKQKMKEEMCEAVGVK